MSQTTNPYRVPISVADKLESVRERSWKVRLLTALLVAAAVLLAAMGTAMSIDRLATIYDPAWRSLLTLAALAAGGATLVAWIVAARRHVTRNERVAAEVDRQLPELHERWTTVAQVAENGTQRHIHPAMYRQVAHEASTFSPRVDAERVVSTRTLHRAAWACSAVAAVLIGAAIFDWQRAPVLLGRFWLPMANISATKIQEQEPPTVVARGESLDISAQLAGLPVREARLLLETADGKERHVKLIPKGDKADQVEHRLRTVKEPLRYRLRAGDGQTAWHEVQVADRPKLASARLKITPPDYTQMEPVVLRKIPSRVAALVGSKLEFTFRPEAQVQELKLELSGTAPLTLAADADGNYRWETAVEDSFSITTLLTEEHGLTNLRPPQFEIRALPDKPPVVRILTPNQEIAVRPNEKVPVTFEATDDVRIGSAELVIYDETNRQGREPRVLDTIPIPLGNQEGQRKVKAGVEIDLSKYQTVNGAELSFAVRVREDRSLARDEPSTNEAAPNEGTLAEQPETAGEMVAAAESGSQPEIATDEAGETLFETPLAEASSDPSASNTPPANSPSESSTADANMTTAADSASDMAPSESVAAASDAQVSSDDSSNAESDSLPGGETLAAADSAANDAEGEQKDEQVAADDSAGGSDGLTSPLGRALADALPDGLRDMASDLGGMEGNSTSDASRGDAQANQSADGTSSQPIADGPAASSSENNLTDEATTPGAEQLAADGAADENQETTSDRQRLMTNTPGAPQPPDAAPAPPTPNDATAQSSADSQSPSNSENSASPDGTMVADESQATESNPTESPLEANSPNAADNMAQAEEAISGRGGQSPAGQEMANQDRANQNMANQNQPNASSANQQPSPSSAQAQNGAQNQQNQQNGSPSGSTPPPSSQRNIAQLDVPQGTQSSTSNRMKLKIDEWAGSLAGQERIRVEMAIAPMLTKMDELLEAAENLSRSILDEVDGGASWQGKHTRDVDAAGQRIAECLEVIEELEVATHDTPYAFVGLQMVNIGKTQVQPARRDFWKSLQTVGDSRIEATRSGWQHTVRARELLADLSTRFENTRQEYALADSVEEIKKMYQIFVENSMALLSEQSDQNGSRYNRKMVEFDLDEEYLARLQEVLELRNKMRAELARILADDPRLLRRFLDAQKNRSNVIRYELERLVENQQELNREVLAWKDSDDESRPELREIYKQRHAEDSQALAVDAATLQDKFETWLPLAENSSNADVQMASKLLQKVATATEELGSDAELYIEQQQAAKIRVPEPEAEDPEAQAAAEPVPSPGEITLEKITADAQGLNEELISLEVALRQLGLSQDRPEMAAFAANRLIETRQLIAKTEEWIRQMGYHLEDSYHNAAEVSQYRLAMETDGIAGKLSDLEQQMTALLQRTDNKLPESIATQARDLLASLDEQAAPNQLSAVYALRRNQLPRAVSRQESALSALQTAAKSYDDMIEAAIKELDKLPVQDPIASLLDDPTLDELLAELEQEFLVQDLLGIPRRPSNLQIMGDFSRPGGDNALMTGGGRQMMLNQLMQRQQLRQRRLNDAYRRAVARALNEKDQLTETMDGLQLAEETEDWNVLLSQLEENLNQDADKAAPERYRRAIEQYFRQTSRPDMDSMRN